MHEVIVLMSTYNGEKYLKTQIDSILAQEGVKVRLLVRDDGSQDSTQKILQSYADLGKLNWYAGKNVGSAKSFMNLIHEADECEYYAFSDQDDFWLPQKLEKAINILEKQDGNKPLLYYGQTTLVDADLNIISQDREERVFTRFCNAIVSSSATGCTFCFNKVLKDIINIYTPKYQMMHDGWLHKVCLAVGGNAYYDENSYIYYRQHEKNVIGGTTTPMKRWSRRINTVKKNRCPRSRGVKEILKGYGEYMPEENREMCEKVVKYKTSLKSRIQLACDNTIYSTNKRIDLMFRITVLLGLF